LTALRTALSVVFDEAEPVADERPGETCSGSAAPEGA
jgi:hypothetical protein